jgi:hypothetical protein
VRHEVVATASSSTVDESIATRGYSVLRRVIHQNAIQDALRHIHLDLVQRGLPPETMGRWLWSADWFPHLKWNEPIVGLAECLPDELSKGELCDPQIILQPPDDCDDQPLVPHVDQEPEWADGRRFRRIVGIALSPGYVANGGLVVWPFDRGGVEAIELEPGDAVVMHPQLPHSSGLNREGGIRYAVYFRFLEPPVTLSAAARPRSG